MREKEREREREREDNQDKQEHRGVHKEWNIDRERIIKTNRNTGVSIKNGTLIERG